MSACRVGKVRRCSEYTGIIVSLLLIEFDMVVDPITMSITLFSTNENIMPIHEDPTPE